jgi:hypothetical protein
VLEAEAEVEFKALQLKKVVTEVTVLLSLNIH